MRLFFSLSISFMTLFLYSQNYLSGKLTTDENQPIEFATIYLINSKERKVVSNENGEFQLNTNKLPDTLIIEHLAYKSQKIFINNTHDLTLQLHNKYIDISEITIDANQSTIHKIVKAINENYPTSPTANNYQLVNKVQTKDSIVLGYFDGVINLEIPTYIDYKKRINAYLINTTINFNNYKKIPDFYYRRPHSIISFSSPSKLPFIKELKKYQFTEEYLLDKNIGKLSFEPKNTEAFTYKGYIYYDLFTFAILFIEMDLVENVKNTDRLISIGFRKSASLTRYSMEKYKIQYSRNKNNKYELDKLNYISDVNFSTNNKEYNIKTNLNLLSFNTESIPENKIKLNLYDLKTSKYKKDGDHKPYINPSQQKMIEKMIEKELIQE